jgi:hypothetical protein
MLETERCHTWRRERTEYEFDLGRGRSCPPRRHSRHAQPERVLLIHKWTGAVPGLPLSDVERLEGQDNPQGPCHDGVGLVGCGNPPAQACRALEGGSQVPRRLVHHQIQAVNACVDKI